MPSDWGSRIDQAVDERFAEIVRLRRHLHAHPELSCEEMQTSLRLYQMLGDDGFEVRMGPEGRGVLADTRSPSAKSTSAKSTSAKHRIALRADIDALHIHDAKDVEYRSQNDGVMHACGHDAHTAMVYGAVTTLKRLADSDDLPWPINVRAIFQPAEEVATGAKEMIDVGALEGVEAILATHVDPSRRVGRIGIRSGVLTANCDEVVINIVGRGGHAARPHEAIDPVAAAAQLINAIYLTIPRKTDSQEAVVVTIGQIVGGDHANVIPEEAVLRGTVRTLDKKIREQTFDHIHRLARGIESITDTKITVTVGMGCSGVINSPELIHLLAKCASDVIGHEGLDQIERPSMGSEDFSFYLEQVPGAMIRIGCSSDSVPGSPLHSATFDIDEETLRIGAKVLARAAVLWSDPHAVAGETTSQPVKGLAK